MRSGSRKLNLLNSITRDHRKPVRTVSGYTHARCCSGSRNPVIAEFIAKIGAAAEVMQRQIEFTRNYQDLGMQAPGWHRISDSVLAAKPQNIALTCSVGTGRCSRTR